MGDSTFDLTKEPWIRVRTVRGDLREVSLREVFAQAHEITAIAGELPTQDVAILRLLLAILRRSHQDAHGTEAWGHLWRKGAFDPAPIGAYLDRFQDRFDLIHPRTPFYQVADLATSKGVMTDLARLIADVPAGHSYFTTRAGLALASIDLSEASRWLVHCHGWDTGAIKTGAAGDPRVKGGRGYSSGFAGNGIGWCGLLGLILVEGVTLFETLLLNLPIGRKDSDPQTDLPVWERPPHGPRPEGRLAPSGPADVQTWQGRRIRIGHQGRSATSVLIAYGDPLDPLNRRQVEFMTNWRFSENQAKKADLAEASMPIAHRGERAIWRGLASVLAVQSPNALANPGRWLEWIEALRADEELPRDHPIRLRIVGAHYRSNNTEIDDIIDDALSVSLATVSTPEARALAVDAVADADSAVGMLGSLAADLVEAAGQSGDRLGEARTAGRELGYAVLDAPYRAWLRMLRSDTDRDAARSEWQRTVLRILTAEARGLMAAASPAAWTGREVARGSGLMYLDAALAESTFFRRIRAQLGTAAGAPTEGKVA